MSRRGRGSRRGTRRDNEKIQMLDQMFLLPCLFSPEAKMAYSLVCQGITCDVLVPLFRGIEVLSFIFFFYFLCVPGP